MSDTPTENTDMNSLNFQDLVILKQFLEKGFRQNFFNVQEINGARLEHLKLSNIIQDIIKKNQG